MHNVKLTYTIVGILLHFLTYSKPLPQPVNNYGMFWLGYYPVIKVKRISIQTDIQYRQRIDKCFPSQVLIRTAVLRSHGNNVKSGGGVAFFYHVSSPAAVRLELRFFEEAGYRINYRKFEFNNRFRIEQKVFNTKNENQNQTELRHRARYKAEALVPLKTGSLSLSLGNEFMVQLFDKALSFDQNRLSAGLQIQATERLNIQPQFIYIIQKTKSGQDHISVFRLNLQHAL